MNKQSNILFKDLSKGQLILIIEEQSAQIKNFISQVNKLTKEIEKFKHPKNSSNSSIPPSKDENMPKQNQSLREKTGRKPGGQKGHPGDTLRMTATPDEIIMLVPEYCNRCGNDLSAIEAILESKRQAIEIPPIRTKYMEYQRFSKQCGCQDK